MLSRFPCHAQGKKNGQKMGFILVHSVCFSASVEIYVVRRQCSVATVASARDVFLLEFDAIFRNLTRRSLQYLGIYEDWCAECLHEVFKGMSFEKPSIPRKYLNVGPRQRKSVRCLHTRRYVMSLGWKRPLVS